MKRKISFVIIFILTASIFGFGIFNDNPLKKDSKAKKQAQKLIDAGIYNHNTNELLGPGFNNSTSVINESFEGTTFPPPGWTKLNPDGGPGWNQQINGTSPIPGWNGGTITTPVGGGNKVAFCTWTTGGSFSNDQWLVTPQITNVQTNDSLKFSLRYWPNSYRDSIEVWISTSTPVIGNFTTLVFRKDFPTPTGDTTWQQYKFRIGNLVSAGANIYIGFREVVADNFNDGASFSLDLVSTTGVAAFTNDIAATSVDVPFGTIALPAPNIAPKATYTNVGAANQTNIPVKLLISGPVNYTGNSTIASLTSGNSIQVTFPATFTPTAGTYNVTAIANLSTDQNKPNDTTRSTFTVIQPNFGGGGPNSGGYYFANSTPGAAPAPSQPTYCRVDTAGSTSLVVNSVASVALDSGSLDDGRWKLTGVTGSNRIKFMGTLYSDVYVGTNGIIAFVPFTPTNGNWYPPTNGLPGPGNGAPVRPAIYPAWNDLNWGNLDQPINRLSYKVDGAKRRLIVTYDRAPLFGGDSTQWETFQVCIDLVPNSGASPNSNFTFSHDNTTSVIQTNYLVGIQDSTGANYIQYTFINSAGNIVTPGPLFDTTAGGGVSITFGPNPTTLNGPCEKILALTMNLQVCESPSQTFVLLRNATSPFAIVDSVVATAGIDLAYPIYFEDAGNGVPYYVVVRTANALETWSASTVTFNGGSTSYDFTTSLSAAFGSNQILNIGGVPSIYQGDADHDGSINLTDVLQIYGVAITFTSTPETNLDCVGDTDLTDIITAFNNATNFVQVVRP